MEKSTHFLDEKILAERDDEDDSLKETDDKDDSVSDNEGTNVCNLYTLNALYANHGSEKIFSSRSRNQHLTIVLFEIPFKCRPFGHHLSTIKQ